MKLKSQKDKAKKFISKVCKDGFSSSFFLNYQKMIEYTSSAMKTKAQILPLKAVQEKGKWKRLTQDVLCQDRVNIERKNTNGMWERCPN